MANKSNIVAVSNIVYGVREQFERVTIDNSINFEREAAFAMQILEGNDFLLSTAMKDPASMRAAIENVSAIGISLNPARKQAYLVPRGGKICLDISYMGMLDIAISSGSIQWGKAEVVYANDSFSLNGFDKPPRHDHDPFSTERGNVVGVYVVVKMHSGDYLTDTMPIADVMKIKARSESGKKGNGPWSTDFNEMAKKTIIRRAYKTWPKTERLDNAIHHMDTEGGTGIDFKGEVIDVCPSEVLTAWTNKAAACTTADALTRVWQEGLAIIKPYRDQRAYDTFKGVVGERGERLKQDESRTVDMPPADDQAAEFQADFEEKMRREGED
nr:recombinase RecT [Robbsia andropogonis]